MRKEVAAAVLATLAVTAIAPAGAAEKVVVKCVAADGAVSYRSGRCEAGQQAVESWSASPGASATATRAEARARQREADAAYLRKLATRYRGRGSRRGPEAEADACALARRARADARRDAHLDYDARDKLDDAVMRACY